MNNQTLKNDVMFRVKTVHSMRKYIHPFRLKVFTLVVSVVAMAFLVSVPNVLQNMLSTVSLDKMVKYFFFAFFQTNLIIQLVTLASIFSALWIIKDAISSFRSVFQLSTN